MEMGMPRPKGVVGMAGTRCNSTNKTKGKEYLNDMGAYIKRTI